MGIIFFKPYEILHDSNIIRLCMVSYSCYILCLSLRYMIVFYSSMHVFIYVCMCVLLECIQTLFVVCIVTIYLYRVTVVYGRSVYQRRIIVMQVFACMIFDMIKNNFLIRLFKIFVQFYSVKKMIRRYAIKSKWITVTHHTKVFQNCKCRNI